MKFASYRAAVRRVVVVLGDPPDPFARPLAGPCDRAGARCAISPERCRRPLLADALPVSAASDAG